jgi:hypothetical protein
MDRGAGAAKTDAVNAKSPVLLGRWALWSDSSVCVGSTRGAVHDLAPGTSNRRPRP